MLFSRAGLSLRAATAAPLRRQAAPMAARFHLSAAHYEPRKPDVKNIKRVREEVPGTSLTKAREALLVSRPDGPEGADSVEAAIAWLEKDRQASGAAKAQKLGSRSANEGAIALAVLRDGWSAVPRADPPARAPASAAIVELACETDFVAKSPIFQTLARDIVHTAANFPLMAGGDHQGLHELDLEQLNQFPILPSHPAAPAPKSARTIQEAIVDVVARLGENIQIRRAAAFFPSSPLAAPETASLTAAYAHNAFPEPASELTVSEEAKTELQSAGYSVQVGKVGALILTQLQNAPLVATHEPVSKQVRALGRSLARQAAGMPTSTLHPTQAIQGPVAANEESEALLEQPFIMLLGSALPADASFDRSGSVHSVLSAWSQATKVDVQTAALRRWAVGETTADDTPSGDDFAAEVRKAAGI